jgi:hypothetical protein
MVKLDVQTTDEIPTPQQGKTYEITEVSEFKSQVRSFAGLRVAMKDSAGNEVVEAIWTRSPVGPKSKLGSFILVLGKDTAAWVGKRITFIVWATSNRVIQLATPDKKGR